MPTLNQLLPSLMNAADTKALMPIDVQQRLQNVADTEFNYLQVDSRKLESADVFVLLKSQHPNPSHPTTIAPEKIQQYLSQAAAAPVAFVLSEIDLTGIAVPSDLTIVYLPDIRDYLGSLIQANLQQIQPVALPKVVAVTGTNGKTTVSQLIGQLVSLSAQKTAVMGTAGNGIVGVNGQLQLTPTTHTTLEVHNMQQHLHQMAGEGVQILAIEASSHGLHQQRLQGMPITVAVYTNLSRDHLDYHSDMEDYANAKARLFDKVFFPSLTHAVINLDDEFAALMMDRANQSGLTVWTYSMTNEAADFFAKAIRPSLDGVGLTIQLSPSVSDQTLVEITSPLLGRFNVANLLASIAGAMALGVSVDDIIAGVPNLQGATGRMDRVPSNVGAFIVDYAHTPDALEQVLTSLKPHCEGALWAVFGCGGDRDKGKRPLMAQAALRLADKVILTADNPRTENPNAILKDMQAGMSCEQHEKAEIEPDRKSAIQYAVQNAKPNDIVVIAGKGHETYQEINGVRYDFDDRVVVSEALAKFGK